MTRMNFSSTPYYDWSGVTKRSVYKFVGGEILRSNNLIIDENLTQTEVTYNSTHVALAFLKRFVQLDTFTNVKETMSGDQLVRYVLSTIEEYYLANPVDEFDFQEFKKDIEDGKVIPNWDDEGPEESRLHDLGIETEIEILDYPTPGTSSTYYDPGDPGDSGEYETSIVGTSSGSEKDNQELARMLGVRSIEDIPTLDEIAAGVLNDALYIRKTCYDLGMEEAANWLIESAISIESNLQRLYEEKDSEYFENEGSIQSEYELYDLADETAYDSIKYLIRFSMVDNKSNRLDANQSIREKVKLLTIPVLSDDLINILKQIIELPWDIRYQQKKHFK